MKKLLILMFLGLISCKSTLIRDLSAFNGRVLIDIKNTSPVLSLSDSLELSLEIPLKFENIVNKNKIVAFDKAEVAFFYIGLSISDTSAKVLEADKDFEIVQEYTTYDGREIAPSWNKEDNLYRAKFKIRFLRAGKYMFRPTNHTFQTTAKNFLLNEKTLTVDFNVKSRHWTLYKKSFPHLETFKLSDNPTEDKNRTLDGFYLVSVEK